MQTSAAGRKQDESKRSARTCRFRKTWNVTDAWTYPPHHICLFAHKPWYLSLCLPNVAIPARFSTGFMHACEGAMKSSSPVNLSPAENDILFVQNVTVAPQISLDFQSSSRFTQTSHHVANQYACCSELNKKNEKKTKKCPLSVLAWHSLPLAFAFFNPVAIKHTYCAS